LEAWTERSAIKCLIVERNRFEEKGWIAAEDFLNHFLEQDNPGKDYTPDAKVVAYIQREARPMARKVIMAAMSPEDANARKALEAKLKIGRPFNMPEFKTYVRWIPGSRENFAMTFWDGPEPSNLRVANNGLFYAFGGARMIVSGTVEKIRLGIAGWDYDVSADVKIVDVYSFPDDIRAWGSNVYAAAAYLQNDVEKNEKGIKNYKPFTTVAEWNELYKSF
jgi:hypothetical protein